MFNTHIYLIGAKMARSLLIVVGHFELPFQIKRVQFSYIFNIFFVYCISNYYCLSG